MVDFYHPPAAILRLTLKYRKRTIEDACKKELIGQVCTTLNNAVKQLIADNIASNRAWTHTLLLNLVELGVSNEYGVCPWPESMKGSWLYDLIWYVEEAEGECPLRIRDVILALESEWSLYLCDIRYDFQKLVQAKSRIKVMLCRMLADGEMEELKKDIETFARKDESETYLLVFCNSKHRALDYWEYGWQDGNGIWLRI